MNLDSSVDRLSKDDKFLNYMKNSCYSSFTQKVKVLQGKLHNCDVVWRCCNCLKENNYSAQLRLAMHNHSHTLYPVQPRILG